MACNYAIKETFMKKTKNERSEPLNTLELIKIIAVHGIRLLCLYTNSYGARIITKCSITLLQ